MIAETWIAAALVSAGALTASAVPLARRVLHARRELRALRNLRFEPSEPTPEDENLQETIRILRDRAARLDTQGLEEEARDVRRQLHIVEREALSLRLHADVPESDTEIHRVRRALAGVLSSLDEGHQPAGSVPDPWVQRHTRLRAGAADKSASPNG